MDSITKGMKKQERYEALYRIRLKIVELLEAGKSNKEIAELLDVSQSHVSKIKLSYQYNGLAALKIYEHSKPWGEENANKSQKDLV